MEDSSNLFYNLPQTTTPTPVIPTTRPDVQQPPLPQPTPIIELPTEEVNVGRVPAKRAAPPAGQSVFNVFDSTTVHSTTVRNGLADPLDDEARKRQRTKERNRQGERFYSYVQLQQIIERRRGSTDRD